MSVSDSAAAVNAVAVRTSAMHVPPQTDQQVRPTRSFNLLFGWNGDSATFFARSSSCLMIAQRGRRGRSQATSTSRYGVPAPECPVAHGRTSRSSRGRHETRRTASVGCTTPNRFQILHVGIRHGSAPPQCSRPSSSTGVMNSTAIRNASGFRNNAGVAAATIGSGNSPFPAEHRQQQIRLFRLVGRLLRPRGARR